MNSRALLFIYLTFVGAMPSAFAATSATTETSATAATITPITSTSINPSAAKGKASQSSGSAANMAAAAMMMAACMATQPPNMALCMMGAMAAAQGAADDDAADQSAATQTATNTSGTTAVKPSFAAASAGSAAFADQEKIKAGMDALKAAGYTATAAGISSASGNIAASSFGSSGAMLAAGLDPAAVKQAEKIGKEVSSKYASMSMAADSSGASGSGGDNGGGNDAGANGDGADKFKNPFALGAGKKAEMMAGKTVQFDGEPIGVKGDDIFQMVHVAYDRKRAGNHFIETDHDPDLNKVLVRAPASLIKPASVNLPPTLPSLGFSKK